MAKISKFILLIGLCLIALSMGLIFAFNVDREVAFWIFLPGFLLIVSGSFISIFGTKFNERQKLFSLGFKIFGAGLLLFFTFPIFTYLFGNDDIVIIIKFISFGICGIGVLTAVIGIMKEQDS